MDNRRLRAPDCQADGWSEVDSANPATPAERTLGVVLFEQKLATTREYVSMQTRDTIAAKQVDEERQPEGPDFPGPSNTKTEESDVVRIRVVACKQCGRDKKKCDHLIPCTRCKTRQIACEYPLSPSVAQTDTSEPGPTKLPRAHHSEDVRRQDTASRQHTSDPETEGSENLATAQNCVTQRSQTSLGKRTLSDTVSAQWDSVSGSGSWRDRVWGADTEGMIVSRSLNDAVFCPSGVATRALFDVLVAQYENVCDVVTQPTVQVWELSRLNGLWNAYACSSATSLTVDCGTREKWLAMMNTLHALTSLVWSLMGCDKDQESRSRHLLLICRRIANICTRPCYHRWFTESDINLFGKTMVHFMMSAHAHPTGTEITADPEFAGIIKNYVALMPGPSKSGAYNFDMYMLNINVYSNQFQKVVDNAIATCENTVDKLDMDSSVSSIQDASTLCKGTSGILMFMFGHIDFSNWLPKINPPELTSEQRYLLERMRGFLHSVSVVVDGAKSFGNNVDRTMDDQHFVFGEDGIMIPTDWNTAAMTYTKQLRTRTRTLLDSSLAHHSFILGDFDLAVKHARRGLATWTRSGLYTSGYPGAFYTITEYIALCVVMHHLAPEEFIAHCKREKVEDIYFLRSNNRCLLAHLMMLQMMKDTKRRLSASEEGLSVGDDSRYTEWRLNNLVW